MPAKGTPLTEEHRAKMQEALQAKKDAEAEAEANALAERQAYLEAEGTQAQAEERAAAEGAEVPAQPIVEPIAARIADPVTEQPAAVPVQSAAPVPTTAPSSQTQGVSEWGPYADYVIVTTPYGNYAVEPGYVMTFVPHRYFNNRERREMITHLPVYTNIKTGRTRDQDMGLAPSIPDVNVEMSIN